MSTKTFAEFLDEIEQDRELAERQRDMKPSRDLALMLVGIRKRLDLTQRALATSAGVSQAYVAQLESGAANPSIRTVDRLLRKTGVVWRMEATIVAPPALDRTAEASVRETGEPDKLTEGEFSHLLRVLDGAVEALRRARVDARPLTKEEMLGEIAAAYDADRRVVRPNSKPALTHRV